MLWLKNDSLESFLTVSLLFLVVIICTLSILLAWKFQLAWHWIVLEALTVFFLCFWFTALIKQRVLRVFTRACLYAEAIAKGELEQFTTSPFRQGKVNELYEHLALLSGSFQANTLNNELKALLNLLPTPVLIINQASEVNFANKALYEYAECQQSVNDLELIAKLNLENKNKAWQLTKERAGVKVLSSQIVREDDIQQLFIFIDFLSTQRELKVQTRHQLVECIHTLGINTLTPIASLSEHLREEHKSSPSIIQSCEAISQSCESFLAGISRYMGFSKNTDLSPQWILASVLLEPYQKNYPDINFDIDQALKYIWCDAGKIQKILFDLIQNAYEAKANNVNVVLIKHEQYAVLEVIDDGEGFNSIEPPLEPFSTTKLGADGLSLYFAKHIIESHSGVFEHQNNVERGATIMIILPFPTDSQSA